MQVERAVTAEYEELLSVWDDSVLGSYDYILEEEITLFKRFIVEQVFPSVSLHCVKDRNGSISAFIGSKNNKVEMLFVKNALIGNGLGKKLLQYAVLELSCNKVDVNEENKQAIAFYKRMVFLTESRSLKTGKASTFNVLHMQLAGQ